MCMNESQPTILTQLQSTLMAIRVGTLKRAVTPDEISENVQCGRLDVVKSAREYITQAQSHHLVQLRFSKLFDLSDAILDWSAFYFIPSEKREFNSKREQELQDHITHALSGDLPLQDYARKFTKLMAEQMAHSRFEEKGGGIVFTEAKKLKAALLECIGEITLPQVSTQVPRDFRDAEKKRRKGDARENRIAGKMRPF